ncbi:hypothetical protein [Streptomyces sp. SID5910]|uniref:hypothetical protein n=1 Tax=Streptomyces sp. SID5910 TaxID=2690312 RepID=UPI0013705084|nr:hypothetical protein [Streptomyces sp. SID5910]MYR45080.1 hypothetical protein [Streptomyces sp. SID5910]
MADNEARAAELDQLADDLEALLNYDEPFDERPGPFIANSDTDHSGYDTVATYVRERAAWLRAQS